MKTSLGAKTLALPTPVWCVGAYDTDGRPNVMTIAWGGICCSKPPMLAVALRAATYTHGCVLARGAFTVSVPAARHVAEADFLGLASGRDMDKFAAAGLTPVRAEFVDAPYVAEFPMVIECRLAQTLELGLHTQFIGEIMDVKVDESLLDEAGHPSLPGVDPLVFAPGSRGYYRVGESVGAAFSCGRPLLTK